MPQLTLSLDIYIRRFPLAYVGAGPTIYVWVQASIGSSANSSWKLVPFIRLPSDVKPISIRSIGKLREGLRPRN